MKLFRKFISKKDWETGIATIKIYTLVCVVLIVAVVALVTLTPSGPGQPTTAEIAFWRSVSPRQPAELELYLKTWPHGAFVSLAKLRLDELYEEAQQTPPGRHQ